MNTLSRTLLTLLIAGGLAFGAAACNSDSKCEQAFAHMEGLHDDDDVELTDEEKKMQEEMQKEMLAECEKAYEEEPEEVGELLDCWMDIDDPDDDEAFMECGGFAGF